MKKALENLAIQKKLTFLVAALFLIKLLAWYLTNSVAILTDALEYTINLISGLIGLYSLSLSAKPRDYNHPYGHGKIEFLSATIEGTLMIFSSFVIIYEAIHNLKYPHEIGKLDFGMALIGFTGLVNYVAGQYFIKKGKKNNSLALIASGKHLKADTYATIGVIIGLALMYFTKMTWIDSLVAFIFAIIVVISGYKIVRSSIAGIMDERDSELLDEMVKLLEAKRSENWVDLHNVRIIKYGSTLHLDCHVTVPWYFNVHQAHDEIDKLSALIKENFGESVELFVHTDGCLDFSCQICQKQDCLMRQKPFEKHIVWDLHNISLDKKHSIN